MQAHESVLQDENDSSKNWHFLAIFLAFVGLLISLYGVYHHRLVASLGQSEAFCNINSTINCDAVAASAYSHFLRIPWAVWGTAYFFAVLLLLICSLKRFGNRQEHLLAYSISVVMGCAISIALGFISFKVLGIACLICIANYLVNLLQAILLYFGLKRGYISFKNLNLRSLSSALINTSIGFAIVLISYNIIGEQNTPSIPKSSTPEIDAVSGPVHQIPLSLTPYSGLGEDYRKGPDDAKIQLVIFSDFECPACRGVSDHLEEIYQSFPGKILMVYRNYPLDQSCNPIMQHKMHQHACSIALIARCAGRYGKFWSYHDLAFSKQSELKASSAKQWAKEIGLTDEQISTCLNDKSIADKLKEDIDLGTQLGIDATPTIFLNGRRFSSSVQELKDEIKKLTGL